MERKNCPYCGEEIMAVAKKCKHCGEWLTDELRVRPETSDEPQTQPDSGPDPESPQPNPAPEPSPVTKKSSTLKDDEHDDDKGGFNFSKYLENSFLPAVFMGVASWLLIHFGSWHLVFGKQNILLELLSGKSGLIWEEFCVLIRINDGYYGFYKDTTYFDSPVIQWIMLAAGIVFFWTAIGRLLGVDTDD